MGGDSPGADRLNSGSSVARTYPERPIAAVGVVVLKGDRVLLVRRGRAPRKGEWSLPGGAQKLGETVAQAAEREVREETGVEIRLTGLLDVVDSIIASERPGRPQYHYTLIDLAAEWVSGEPCAATDAAAVAWVPVAEAGDLVGWGETRRILRLAVERRR